MRIDYIVDRIRNTKLANKKSVIVACILAVAVGITITFLLINRKPVTNDISSISTQTINTIHVDTKRQSTLRGKPLYVDPTIAASGVPIQIASQPLSMWLGDWTKDVRSDADTIVTKSTASGTLATIVAYDIPNRDCDGHSDGGAATSSTYRDWINSMADGIGNREVVVILEPDGLAQMDCLADGQREERYADLSFAIDTFAVRTKAYVYVDAGHSGWKSADDMATRLHEANIDKATGFALNVSNFQTTESSTDYGNKIASRISKPFVIDTGRNGNGSNGEWCNPKGRALGTQPTTATTGYLDGLLWIKRPGQSDGTCNGGPAAGVRWDAYAQELITNSTTVKN